MTMDLLARLGSVAAQAHRLLLQCLGSSTSRRICCATRGRRTTTGGDEPAYARTPSGACLVGVESMCLVGVSRMRLVGVGGVDNPHVLWGWGGCKTLTVAHLYYEDAKTSKLWDNVSKSAPH